MEKGTLTFARPGSGPRHDKVERRFAHLRTQLEEFGIRNEIKLSDPEEKIVWDHLMKAIDHCHTLEISLQEQRQLFI